MIDTKALAIHCIPGLPCDARLKIYSQVHDHRDLTKLSWWELATIGGVNALSRRRASADSYQREHLLAYVERLQDVLYRERIGICSYLDPSYPPMLREMYDPPFVLFHTGTMPPLDIPSLGVVGTRRPTRLGEREGFRIALEAGYAGIPIISGLARGIDSAAHNGAIAADGKTWAVLGFGIRTRVSRFTQELIDRMIAHGGGLISEYEPYEDARTWYFPQRNRIISGLSRSLIVVEAPEGSGALITADFALDQGRDVYVHSCGVQGEWSVGTKRLAESGAPILSSIGELLSDWGWAESCIPRTTCRQISACELLAPAIPGTKSSEDCLEVRYQQTLFRRCDCIRPRNPDLDR